MHVRRRRPSPAFIVACVALFVALGGPAQAARLLNGKLIRKGTVSSKQIRDRGVTLRDLSRGAVRDLQRTPARSVGTSQLADGAVGASQLRAGAVTAGALAANSLTGATIADGSIGTAELADGAVTTDKIGNGQVKKADIATGAVGRAELGSRSVSGGEVQDGTLAAVDVADFSGTATPALASATVAPNACATGVTTALAPNLLGASLLDDVVLAGQPHGFPPSLTVTARPASASTLQVSVCNVTGAPVTLRSAKPAIPFVAIQS